VRDLSTAPDPLTAAEVAELLECSERTLYELRRTGELPASRIGGRYYYRKSTLLAALTPERPAS
jgi:excisionase family DNA binding protein